MAHSFNGRSKNPKVRLIVGAVVLLGAACLIFYNYRWIRSVLEGPVPFALSDLQEVTDPATLPNPWVSLAFNEAIDTGFVMESTKAGKTTSRSKYLLIRVGDRWLITDVPAGFNGNQVVGYLDTWWSPLSNKVIDHVKRRFPDHRILSYQLNAEYSYRGQCFAMLGIAAFTAFVGLIIMGYAWSDLRKTTSMPWGSGGGTDQPMAAEN